jgi:hypothetical protein
MPAIPAETFGGITLRATVELAEREPYVALTLGWGSGAFSPRLPVYTLNAFGIPREASPPKQLKLPSHFADDLRRGLESAPRGPVWLRLEQPAGYLAAVPWEGLDLEGRTLLRLPDQMDVPQQVTRYQRLAIVACTGGGLPWEVVHHIRVFIEQLREAITDLEVHLFADDNLCGAMQDVRLDHLALHVHRPEVVSEQPQRVSGAAPFPIEEMTRTLDGAAVQALHLVMPGAFDGTRPALMASGLDGGQAAKFADDGDVKRLADSVGAPMISVSAAPGGDEAAARMVTDLVGATRPGPTIFAGFDQPGTVPLAEIHRVIASPGYSMFDNPRYSMFGNVRNVPTIGDVRNFPTRFYYIQPEVFTPLPRLLPPSHRALVEHGQSPWLGGIGLRAISEGEAFDAPVELPLWAAAATRFVESRRADIDQLMAVNSDQVNPYLKGASSALDDIQALITYSLPDPS